MVSDALSQRLGLKDLADSRNDSFFDGSGSGIGNTEGNSVVEEEKEERDCFYDPER